MNEIRELTDPIAKKNGKEVISVVAIEECSELQKEITKMMRERGNKMNLLEEMADGLYLPSRAQTVLWHCQSRSECNGH